VTKENAIVMKGHATLFNNAGPEPLPKQKQYPSKWEKKSIKLEDGMKRAVRWIKNHSVKVNGKYVNKRFIDSLESLYKKD
jgi:hypothetical protein